MGREKPSGIASWQRLLRGVATARQPLFDRRKQGAFRCAFAFYEGKQWPCDRRAFAGVFHLLAGSEKTSLWAQRPLKAIFRNGFDLAKKVEKARGLLR